LEFACLLPRAAEPAYPHPEKLMLSMKARCGLLVVAAIIALGGSVAVAQNLDQGKPAPKLFAESCAACHRSPRGLAKGRFHLTLYLFLQKHYASGSSSAWALTSYLESVDSGKRAAAKKPAASTARTSLRPPAPVPAR
jgi:mono/diheme cytochrome c family protein